MVPKRQLLVIHYLPGCFLLYFIFYFLLLIKPQCTSLSGRVLANMIAK